MYDCSEIKNCTLLVGSNLKRIRLLVMAFSNYSPSIRAYSSAPSELFPCCSTTKVVPKQHIYMSFCPSAIRVPSWMFFSNDSSFFTVGNGCASASMYSIHAYAWMSSLHTRPSSWWSCARQKRVTCHWRIMNNVFVQWRHINHVFKHERREQDDMLALWRRTNAVLYTRGWAMSNENENFKMMR